MSSKPVEQLSPGDRPLRGRLRRRHAADRHRSSRRRPRARQRHLDASRTSRPRSARRPARCRASRASSSTSRPRHPHAGRRPERARRDEPRRAQDEPQGPAEGGTLIVEHRRVQRAQPREGGLRGEPARGRLAGRVPGARGPLTSLTAGRSRTSGLTPGGGPRRRTSSRSGWCPGSTAGRSRPTIDFIEKRSSRSGPRSPRRTSQALQGRLRVRRDRRDLRGHYEVEPAKLAPGIYRNITGNQALALGLVAASQLVGLTLFLGAYPITPASRSCTSSPATSTSACGRSRPRTRSPRSARRSARRSAARSASPRRRARASRSRRRRSASP